MSENERVTLPAKPLRFPLPELGHGEVQVFRLRANGNMRQYDFAFGILSHAEQKRAAEFRVEGAREEFVVGRAAVRPLLGAVLKEDPSKVGLGANRYGKPTARGIDFNVSHSRGLIYVALCRDAPVGVDVEWIDPGLEVMELAEPNFSAEESRTLAGVFAGAEQAAAFYRIWTRKEAVAKADGRGLGIALRDILLPDGLPGVAIIRDGSAPESVVTSSELPMPGYRYRLWDVEAPADFAAAISVRDSNSPIVCRAFPLELISSGVS